MPLQLHRNVALEFSLLRESHHPAGENLCHLLLPCPVHWPEGSRL